MIEALGTIARSGTKAFLESLQDNKDKSKNKNEMNLIGQFGVGFYSAFMVADRVEVISLKAGTEKAFKWESDGSTGFSISEDNRDEAGTTIILHLKKADKEYSDETRLTHLVKKYSNHVSYPIKIAKKDAEAETINAVEALWTKSPKDISKWLSGGPTACDARLASSRAIASCTTEPSLRSTHTFAFGSC